MSVTEVHVRPSYERLLRAAFWTLWPIVIVFAGYGYAAEFFGLSIFGQGSAPKYHMGAEAHLVGAVALFAMFMLAVVTFYVRRFSRALYRLGLLACAFQFFDILIPRF